jgi:hypothetical protein
MTKLETMIEVLLMGLTPEERALERLPLEGRQSEIKFATRILTGLGLLAPDSESESSPTSTLIALVKRERTGETLH